MICADIAKHFQEKVAPNGFGAQVVTYDREGWCCTSRRSTGYCPWKCPDVVMTVNSGEDEYAAYRRDQDAEGRLLDRFRDPNDPLKLLIVTSKLLTGFDTPILQAMYLDKQLRDHTLLQAICRTNRPYGETKTHGLIVDYLGIFDDVAQAIHFDEEGITRVVTNINELVAALPAAVQKCLAWFSGIDRTVTGYKGLIAAQECLPDNEARDRFAADYSYLARLWDAISPDPSLEPYEADHGWLGQVYESVKPSTGTGKLLWHTLGAKTIDLIHRHVHVAAVRDDLETLVLDEEVLDAVLGTTDPEKESKEVEIRVAERLRRHLNDPRFRALGERLEELRQKHEQGFARQYRVPQVTARSGPRRGRGRADHRAGDARGARQAALTELFEEARNDRTPDMIERVVNDIRTQTRTAQPVRVEGRAQLLDERIESRIRQDPVQPLEVRMPVARRKVRRLHHIGDAWRADGLLPIAMVVQCTNLIPPGPGRIRDFRHRLLAVYLAVLPDAGPPLVERLRWRSPRRGFRAKLAEQAAPDGDRTARVLTGYRRTAGDRGQGQARPFGLLDLAAVLATCHRPRRRGRGARPSPTAQPPSPPATPPATANSTTPAPPASLQHAGGHRSPRPRSARPTPHVSVPKRGRRPAMPSAGRGLVLGLDRGTMS